MKKYDLIVVGGGFAGTAAASVAMKDKCDVLSIDTEKLRAKLYEEDALNKAIY